MTDREVMQQALDVLERVALHLMRPQDVEVMQALRARLEQQAEPVAHLHEWFRTGAMEPGKMRCIHCGASGNDASLTTSPQQQTEPVALIRDGVLLWHIPHEHYARPTWTAHGTHMLYTTPPHRQWVGLEAKDLAQIESDEFWSSANHMSIALAVEDKLKEKNT